MARQDKMRLNNIEKEAYRAVEALGEDSKNIYSFETRLPKLTSATTAEIDCKVILRNEEKEWGYTISIAVQVSYSKAVAI